MPVTCVEILPDGTPGRSVELGPVLIGCPNEASDYAERAAYYFDDRGMGTWNYRTVEVRGLPGGPERFRVRCEVVRNYRAERMESTT